MQSVPSLAPRNRAAVDVASTVCVSMDVPAPSAPNAFQRRLPIVIAAAAVFVVLLVITAITQNNGMGTAVAIYGIVGGVLLGRLLAASEPNAGGPNAD
jgi:hypothetical protein